ncbi:MAG: UDP-N-acetylglucosamine--N-acetylmuramyl-(pentapeptide) pyrophosphoryl-undecaprenol N-acetylglucosamine transferase [bacterium]
MSSYFFVVGASGGHVYPALAIAELLSKKEVFFIARKDSPASTILNGFSYPWITCIATNTFFSFIKNFIMAFFIFKKQRIRCVIGTGAIDTVPIVLAAFICRIPIFLLEQNTIPGRSNRFLQFFARNIYLTFAESQRYFLTKNFQLTGNPICMTYPQNIKNIDLKGLVFAKEKTLLVIGGSQGAHALNDFFIAQQPRLLDAGFNLLVLCGNSYFNKKWPKNSGEPRYIKQNNSISAIYFPYVDRIDLVYQQVDYVVSRAGATTLSELQFYNKCSVLIPYPYSRDNHQTKNALAVIQADNFDILSQDKLDLEVLLEKLSYLKPLTPTPKNQASQLILKTINANL